MNCKEVIDTKDYKKLISKKNRQIDITINSIYKLQRNLTKLQVEKELLCCKKNNDQQGARQLQGQLSFMELQH